MKNAFYYMFKNNDILKKTYVFFLFILVSTLISNLSTVVQSFVPVLNTQWQDSINDPILNIISMILSFIALIVMFVPNGYLLSCVKSLSSQDENYVLPEMSLKCNFLKGLKAVVAFGFIYMLFALIAGAFMAVSIAVAMVLGKQLFFYLTVIAIVLFLITFLFYFPAFNFMFAYKSNLLTYFRFVFATKIMTFDKKQYFKYTSVFAIIFILSTFIVGICSNIVFLKNPILLVLSTIIISLISYYVMLVMSFLIAKSVKVEALENVKAKSNEEA